MSFNIVLTVIARFFIFVGAEFFLLGAALLVTSQVRVVNGTITEAHYLTEIRPAVAYLAIALVGALVSIALSLNRSH